jgi:hypothetical protein
MGRKSFAYHVMQYRRECIGTWMYKACDMNLSVLHWIATSLRAKERRCEIGLERRYGRKGAIERVNLKNPNFAYHVA